MTKANLVILLQGVSAAGAWAAGLFFFKFWRESRDRLFVFFAIAFWILSVSWVLLGTFRQAVETRPYIYSLRLVAFALIIAAVIDKNRKRA